MENAIVHVIGTTLMAYFVVRRMIDNAYHRGWKDGFDEAVEIYEEVGE